MNDDKKLQHRMAMYKVQIQMYLHTTSPDEPISITVASGDDPAVNLALSHLRTKGILPQARKIILIRENILKFEKMSPFDKLVMNYGAFGSAVSMIEELTGENEDKARNRLFNEALVQCNRKNTRPEVYSLALEMAANEIAEYPPGRFKKEEIASAAEDFKNSFLDGAIHTWPLVAPARQQEIHRDLKIAFPDL